MATKNIPVGVRDVEATVANFRLHKFKKILDEMRAMMQTAQDELDSINEKVKENLENQKVINAMLEDNKVKRDELLNPKPAKADRYKLRIVK